MNFQNSNDELGVLNLQFVASSIFVITTIISIVLTYNEIYTLKYNKRIISTEKATNIIKVNRVIITILLITFIYINYKTKEFDLRKGVNTIPDDLSILASYISLIAGLIILYTIFKYGEDAVVSTENPEI